MTMRIAINTANLHYGGGLQAAVSFLVELSYLRYPGVEFAVFASTEVNEELGVLSPDWAGFSQYTVRDVHGLSGLWGRTERDLDEFDVVFTVFGPHYSVFSRARHVVGFAQAWVIYPHNEAGLLLPLVRRMNLRLKFFVQGLFFRHADAYVVEAEHVRRALIEQGYGDEKSIRVVPNSLSSIYHQEETWRPVEYSPEADYLTIGFVGRDWLHKNLNILPDVYDVLAKHYQMKVRFVVTLTQDEWDTKSGKFQDVVHNVGGLSVAQCPDFYKKMDGVIFPSLLECFSATPMEALLMGRPLFASNRGFVRDVCGDFANYFEPTSAASIAASIHEYFSRGSDEREDMLLSARKYMQRHSTPVERAKAYADFLISQVETAC